MGSMLKYFTVILVLVCSYSFGQISSTAQKKIVKLFEQAKSSYQMNNYAVSISLLNEVLAIDHRFVDAYMMKSDIYQELDSLELQLESLEQAIRIDPEKNPKLYFVQGNAYYRTGKYKQAISAYENYLDRVDHKAVFVERANQNIQKCNGSIRLLNHPVPFDSVNLGENINSEDDEYWPSITVDGKTLIFTRLVGARRSSGQPSATAQEDFYTSQLVNGSWQPCQPLSEINTPYNEGAQSVSTDGKLLFFTACTRQDGIGSCDIYFSMNKSGNWSVPKNAGKPVNSPSWESQPSISANGESLYFVSNRAGGKGGMDIWKCDLKGFSELGVPIWGQAVNLGDSINTPGNETSPFIHSDGKTLYFASDYWPGLGGYDMFFSRKNGNLWTGAKNLGFPINTNKDEQGLVVDASGDNAYYSSDRPGSRGMDIYSFRLHSNAKPTPVSYIKGKIIDNETGEAICAKVELTDLDNSASPIQGESCWDKGEFLMCLPVGKEYAFNVSKEGYLFYSENFQLKEVKGIVDPKLLEIKLKKIEVGESVTLRNVFFNTDSYELLPQSKVELKRLIDFLNQNKSLHIEIGGHTDNVGTFEYNQKLSTLRAQAVYEYLLNQDISRHRMSFNGYSYSIPMSSNDSEIGRALNRRTEFKITRK